MAGFTRLKSVKYADNWSPAGQLGAERHRPILICADQTGIADYVSDQNGSETALHRIPP